MNTERLQHLTEDEILSALVDERDLDSELKDHLASCSLCREALATQRQSFSALGTRARKYTPEMVRPIRIPQEPVPRRLHFGDLKPVLGAAVAACLLVAVLYGGWMRFAPDRSGLLIEDVDRLVENAMPVEFQNLLGEELFRAEEDFMEFIIPPLENGDDTMGGPENLKKKDGIHAKHMATITA